MAKRLDYIDVAKGILIILVFFHHFDDEAKIHHITNTYTYWLDESISFIFSIVMPAFFVITGFCSNFNKPFKDFAWGSLKSLIWPAFTLGIIYTWLSLMSKCETNAVEYLKIGWTTMLKSGGIFWFLSTLFLCRIFYWFLNKYSTNVTVSDVICLALLPAGILLKNHIDPTNYWHFIHAMCFMIFMHIGQRLKKYGDCFSLKVFLISFIGYVAIRIIYGIFQMELPSVTLAIAVNDLHIFPYLFISVLGDLMIISGCRFIQSNKILEYIGRNTLVIYCLHGPIIRLLFSIFKGFFINDELWSSVIGICLILIISVLLLFFFISILNTKYLKFTLGKF